MEANTKLIVIALVVALVGVGAGYGIGAVMGSGDDATDYHFYLYFEEDDERNGWYAGKGTDAAMGFDNAMKNAKLDYELSGGYLSTVDGEGSWSVNAYLYSDTSEEAMLASVTFQVPDDYFACSNGWLSFNGYGEYDDDQEFKIKQSTSTIFFFSVYVDWDAATPLDIDDWMNDGPFKA